MPDPQQDPSAPPALSPVSYQEFAAAVRRAHPSIKDAAPQIWDDDGALTHVMVKAYPELDQHVIDPLKGAEGVTLPSLTPKTGPPSSIPPPSDDAQYMFKGPVASGVRSALLSPITGPMRMFEGAKKAGALLNTLPSEDRVSAGPPQVGPLKTQEVFEPLADLAGGAMEGGELLLVPAALAAPLPTMIAVGVGTAASAIAQHLAQMAGAPPAVEELAGIVGGVAAGAKAGGMTHEITSAPFEARGRRLGQMAEEDRQAKADIAREHVLQESAMRSDLQAETERMTGEQIADEEQFTRLALAIQQNEMLNQLSKSFAGDGRATHSPFEYLDEVAGARKALPPAPTGPPVLALPPATGPNPDPNVILAPPSSLEEGGLGADVVPPSRNVDIVGPSKPQQRVAESGPPGDPLLTQLGDQLEASMGTTRDDGEIVPGTATPGPPRVVPNELQRVRLRDAQVYKPIYDQAIEDMAVEMENTEYTPGALGDDPRTGETYYVPPSGWAGVYHDIIRRVVGKDTQENGPGGKIIRAVLRTFADNREAATVSQLPRAAVQAGEEQSGLQTRAFRNAYDRWVPEIQRIAHQRARRRLASTNPEVHDSITNRRIFGETGQAEGVGTAPPLVEDNGEGTPLEEPGQTGPPSVPYDQAVEVGAPLVPDEPMPEGFGELPPEEPTLPGLESVPQTENATPEVADLPFGLAPPSAKGGPPSPGPSLFDALKEDIKALGTEEEGSIGVPPRDARGLRKWLQDRAESYGDQPWHESAQEALDNGDTTAAWRIAAIASASEFSAGVGARRREGAEAAGGRPAVAMGVPNTEAQVEATKVAYKKQAEKELGFSLPPTTDISPEGIITFDMGGKGVPAVKARATDLTMGHNLLSEVMDAIDPSQLLRVEGSTEKALQVSSQMADQVMRNMSDKFISRMAELLGFDHLSPEEQRTEVARQVVRSPSIWARGLGKLGRYVQENENLMYHIALVEETGKAGELGSVGALQATGIQTPESFVKWIGERAMDKELTDLDFHLPPGFQLKDAKGKLTPAASTYARNWYRRKLKLSELGKSLGILTKDGDALDKAVIATTLGSGNSTRPPGMFSNIFGLGKALLISLPSTFVRNVRQQGLRYGFGMVDDAIAGTYALAAGKHEDAKMFFTEAAQLGKSAAAPGAGTLKAYTRPLQDGMEALYDFSTEAMQGMKPNDIKHFLNLLHTHFPAWEAQFMGSLALEDQPLRPGMISKLRNLVTINSRVQEGAFRAAVGDGTFRSQVIMKGEDPLTMWQHGDDYLIQKYGKEEVDRMVGASVAAALDATFAANPMPDTVPYHILHLMTKVPIFSNAAQILTGNFFPRFNLISAPRWINDHMTTLIADMPLYVLNKYVRTLDAENPDTSQLLRGRYFQMLQRQAQHDTLLTLDTEIARNDVAAADALQAFMASKDKTAVAAEEFKRVEKTLEGANRVLPDVQAELTTHVAALRAQQAETAQANIDYAAASIRSTNLRGQLQKARKKYTDLAMVGAARSPEEYYGRLTTGMALLTAAYVVRNAAYEKAKEFYNAAKGLGEGTVEEVQRAKGGLQHAAQFVTNWDEMPFAMPDLPGMPGHTAIASLRADAPIVQYLLPADLLVSVQHETDWSHLKEEAAANHEAFGLLDEHFWKGYMKKYYHGKYTEAQALAEAAGAFISINPAAGSTKDLLEIIQGRARTGNDTSLQDAVLGSLGQFIGIYGQGFELYNQIHAQFSPADAAARIPEQGTGEHSNVGHELLDPLASHILGVRQNIPTKTSAFTGEPLSTVDPVARLFAGLSERVQTPVEAELKLTGLPYGAAVPRQTGDREFDNAVNKEYASLLNEQFSDVLDNEQYAALTPELKRDVLTSVFLAMKRKAMRDAVSQLETQEEKEGKAVSPGVRDKLDRWKRYQATVDKDLGPEPQEPPESPQGLEPGAPPQVP